MSLPDLTDDCARCAALCCVAFAFDASESFAQAKPAGAPCRHLSDDHRCTIHADRARLGWGGCVGFTCHGAGQYVTQAMFQGRSWRDDPALTVPMVSAFLTLRRVHEARALLHAAGGLALPQAAEEDRQQLLDSLTPPGGWTPEGLATWHRAGGVAAVQRFLAGLRAHVAAPDGSAAPPG